MSLVKVIGFYTEDEPVFIKRESSFILILCLFKRHSIGPRNTDHLRIDDIFQQLHTALFIGLSCKNLCTSIFYRDNKRNKQQVRC